MTALHLLWERLQGLVFRDLEASDSSLPATTCFIPGVPITTYNDAVISRLALKNVRDLASATRNIRPGAMYRCSCPYSASAEDLAVLLDQLGVTQLLDLRTGHEWRQDPPSSLKEGAAVFTCTRIEDIGAQMQGDEEAHNSPLIIHRISLQEWSTYTQAFVRQLPLHRALPVLFWVALSRLLRWQPPVLPLRRAILREARREGLPTMYRVILGAFGPEIGCALGVISEAAKAQQPLAMFCKLGKDRTGLLCMLLLACCGASDAEIISDYTRSVDIPPLVLDPDAKKPEAANVQVFAGAPAHVMAGALQHLRQQYGGVASYLESVCGFSRVEQALLQQHLKPA